MTTHSFEDLVELAEEMGLTPSAIAQCARCKRLLDLGEPWCGTALLQTFCIDCIDKRQRSNDDKQSATTMRG